KSVDRDISDTYFNKMCQRIKAMNYSGLLNKIKKYISYYSDFLETIKNQKKYSPNSPSSFDFIYIMKSSYENYYFMFRQE
ncbi:hypothetical protein CYQ70_08220, partial [Enterococcus faecium]|uniref:hypothetical protein n=4 Tax=Enterococcus faecium TaxID=1352 RepID=UPI0010275256